MNGPAIVRTERINKWFDRGHAKDHHVLRDIDLEVTKGEVLVVIGPSGSGKSTLLRCINFLAPPETGSVTFLGETLSQEGLPRFDVRARLDREQMPRVLDVNPNPALNPGVGVHRASAEIGWTWDQFVRQQLAWAL